MQLGSRNLLGDLRDAGFARSHSMIKCVSHPSLFNYFQSYCYCCLELVRGFEEMLNERGRMQDGSM